MGYQENIDRIIHLYLEGTANEDELCSLLGWIKQGEQHVHYFNQICNIWENTSNVDDRTNETEVALNKLNARIEALHHVKTDEIIPFDKVREENISFYFWQYAAIAVILLGVSAFLYFALVKKTTETLPTFVTAIAPKSQKSQLILGDGTKVWLNSGTTLKYSSEYGKKERQIYLDGEAYFEVAKDSLRPFLVHASNITVRAIGTRFNVKCYSDEKTIETTLVEGKVQVSESGSKASKGFVMLLPNERAIYSRINMKLTVDKIEEDKNIAESNGGQPSLQIPQTIASVISWKDQELVFENEPFDQLTTRLERWYNVEILVLDSSVNKNNSYTGKFVHNESLDQVLKIISRTTPIKYTFRNGEVVIEAKTKNNL